jgi:hypothetical protein
MKIAGAIYRLQAILLRCNVPPEFALVEASHQVVGVRIVDPETGTRIVQITGRDGRRVNYAFRVAPETWEELQETGVQLIPVRYPW